MTTTGPIRVPDTTGEPPEQAVAITALPDATEEEAFRQGWFAYCLGLEDDANPYPAGDDPSKGSPGCQWNEGWLSGAADDCG